MVSRQGYIPDMLMRHCRRDNFIWPNYRRNIFRQINRILEYRVCIDRLYHLCCNGWAVIVLLCIRRVGLNCIRILGLYKYESLYRTVNHNLFKRWTDKSIFLSQYLKWFRIAVNISYSLSQSSEDNYQFSAGKTDLTCQGMFVLEWLDIWGI